MLLRLNKSKLSLALDSRIIVASKSDIIFNLQVSAKDNSSSNFFNSNCILSDSISCTCCTCSSNLSFCFFNSLTAFNAGNAFPF